VEILQRPEVVDCLDPPGVLVVEPLSTYENHDPRYQLLGIYFSLTRISLFLLVNQGW
jgi:hypothetical protein